MEFLTSVLVMCLCVARLLWVVGEQNGGPSCGAGCSRVPKRCWGGGWCWPLLSRRVLLFCVCLYSDRSWLGAGGHSVPVAHPPSLQRRGTPPGMGAGNVSLSLRFNVRRVNNPSRPWPWLRLGATLPLPFSSSSLSQFLLLAPLRHAIFFISLFSFLLYLALTPLYI